MALTSAQITDRLKKEKASICVDLLRYMLYESLSPRQRAIYNYIRLNDKSTSMDIRAYFPDSTQGSITTELERLTKLDVVKPIPVSGEGCFHYRWEVKFVLNGDAA